MSETEVLADSYSDTTLSDYGLNWLFDPSRCEHLPINEQLNFYKQRDLVPTKFYNTAAKIWGAPKSRKRVIFAPKMYNLKNNHRTGLIINENCNIDQPVKQTQCTIENSSKPINEIKTDLSRVHDLHEWVDKRKKFRDNIENMGLQDSWLLNKPDKTPLESRVLNQLIKHNNDLRKQKLKPIEQDAEFDKTPTQTVDSLPIIERPSPLALRIIERFLYEKKLRMIDLFTNFDKDKSWTISQTEFRNAVKKAKIGIPDRLLEDLFMTLDTDLDGELSYYELAKGIESWKLEKRASKKKLQQSVSEDNNLDNYLRLYGITSPSFGAQSSIDGGGSKMRKSLSSPCSTAENYPDSLPCAKDNNTVDPDRGHSSLSECPSCRSNVAQTPDISEKDTRNFSGSSCRVLSGSGRVKSGTSARVSCTPERTISSLSSHLQVPPPDTRPERYNSSSHEAALDLRAHNKVSLAALTEKQSPKDNKERQPVIKTGDDAVDNNVSRSTIGGQTALDIDNFRQRQLKEYFDVINMFKKLNLILSEQLLSKVLLFPADKPLSCLREEIRQPSTLVSLRAFSKNTDINVDQKPTSKSRSGRNNNSAKRKRGSAKGNLESFASAYPKQKSLGRNRTKMHLSTGRAYISRQVNCWLTFEEYQHITRFLSRKYPLRHSKSDEGAFWPGTFLNKLRLCFPEESQTAVGSNTIFENVIPSNKEKKIYPGYDNNLKTWPSDSNYVQYGFIDPYKNKY